MEKKKDLGGDIFTINLPPKYVYQQQEHKESYCEMQMKSKMQNNSVAPSVLVIMANSMPLPAYFNYNESRNSLYQINFYVACMIGAFVGAFIIRKFPKKYINIVISSLTIMSGIVFCSSSEYDEVPMIIFRYLQGFSLGIATIVTLVTSSEVAQTKYRGLIGSLESIALATGIFVFATFTTSMPYDRIVLHNMCGAMVITFGVIGLLSIFICVESPLFLLSKDQESNALMAIQKLQKEQSFTTSVYKQFDEIKDLIADDKSRSFKQNLDEGVVPFIKLALIRALNSLTCNYLVILAFIRSSNQQWFAFFGAGKFMSVLLANLFMIESVGRRKLLVSSCIMSAVNLLVIAIVSSGTMDFIWITMAFLQFFNGFGQVSTSVYLGEAFSVSVKPWFIALIVSIESLVQIILFACWDAYEYFPYFSALLILFLLSIPFSMYMFPETAGLTLKESRWRFLNWVTK